MRVKDVLIKETGAKRMFPGQRHSLDTVERPTIDYGRDGATWEKSGETEPPKSHRYQEQYEWVLGVSKNFNPEVCKDQNDKPNPGFIAELPFCHRTPVAMYEWSGVRYAVWYLRLRETELTRSIFDGVVEVEKSWLAMRLKKGSTRSASTT